MTRDYVRALRRALRSRGVVADTLVREVAGHLEDSYEQELERGVDPARAKQLAISRFGPVNAVADRLAADEASAQRRAVSTKAPPNRPAASVRRPRSPGTVYAVLSAVLVVMVGTLALRSPRSAPPTIAEFAPQAVERITDAEDAADGSGRGASAARAPEIDPLTGLPKPGGEVEVARVRKCVGDPPRQIEDPQSPPCVPYWSGDNGGATWQGVTRDSIVVFAPMPSSFNEFTAAVMRAFESFFNRRFEFYGRKLVLAICRCGAGDGSVTDQEARAVYADEQVKAFASTFYLYGGGFHFTPALAKRGVILSMGDFETQYDAETLNRYAPYVWSYLMSADRELRNIGQWACGRLAGRNASHAGTPDLQGSRRVFGILKADAAAKERSDVPSLQPLLTELEACGAKPAAIVDAKDCTGNECQTNAVLNLRTAGVTTIFNLANWGGPGYQQSAKSQGYLPEWLNSSYGTGDYNYLLKNSCLADNTLVGNFGLIFRPRQVRLTSEPYYQALAEHGVDMTHADKQTGGSACRGWDNWAFRDFYRSLLLLASGFQMAGPNLTPETFAAGLHKTRFPNPEHPSVPGRVGFENGSYSMTTDGAEWWFDPAAESPYPAEPPGSACYVDGGRRYALGNWPQGGDPFFQPPCDSGA